MTLPAIPNSGTADTSPLVTLTEYAAITGDSNLTSTNWDIFYPDALDQVQRMMRRTLLYAQYTERLFLYRNGMVYASATPYDVSKAVTAPNGETNGENVAIFQGAGMWVGWFVPLPSLPVWEGVVPPQTDISYWGGYVGSDSSLWGTGPFNLPSELKRIICKVVWFMANPGKLQGLPAGVKSTSVGGVSISGDLSSFCEYDKALKAAIRRWRKPAARRWGAQVTT